MSASSSRPPRRGSLADLIASSASWLRRRGRFREAALVYRTLTLQFARDERGWLGLGQCLEATHDLAGALATYEAAETFAPPAASCVVARCRILQRRGQHELAAQVLERARREAEQGENLEALLVLNAACESIRTQKNTSS